MDVAWFSSHAQVNANIELSGFCMHVFLVIITGLAVCFIQISSFSYPPPPPFPNILSLIKPQFSNIPVFIATIFCIILHENLPTTPFLEECFLRTGIILTHAWVPGICNTYTRYTHYFQILSASLTSSNA